MDVQTNLVEFLRDEDMTQFFPPLVRLVAEGNPVPLSRLAAEAAVPEDRLAGWLRAQPGTQHRRRNDDSGTSSAAGDTENGDCCPPQPPADHAKTRSTTQQ